MVPFLVFVALGASVVALIAAGVAVQLARQGAATSLSRRVAECVALMEHYGSQDEERATRFQAMKTEIQGLVQECDNVLEAVTKKERQARAHANRVNGAAERQVDPEQQAREFFRGKGFAV